ncbi:MAG: hypothetical protein QOI13_3321 [Paraburkholderia sp.]|nr:hypothetical protein [Paraburkholderia sp.]
MRPPFLHRISLFVALLVCSLTSHGPYVVMSGILLLCACCVRAPDVREALFSPRYVAFLSLSATIITAFYLWYLAVPHANTSHELEKSGTNNFVFLLLVLMFLATFSALIEARLDEMATMLSALLVLHCAVLLLQTVMLIVTGRYIDFLQPITGEASRYLNYASVNPIFGYRPTGLYVEPSTFAAAVGAMTVGYVLLSRASGRAPSVLPIALTVVSMLITQSAAAVVQTAVLIAALMFGHMRPSSRVWAAIAVAMLAAVSPGLISAYFNSFMLKFSSDSGMRFALMSYVFHLRQGWDYVFGYGPFSLEYDLYNLASAKATGSPSVASLNDAGLLNYFVVLFGVAGLAIPAAIFLRMRKDVGTVCFFGLLMTTKLSYTAPVLYFGLLPLILRLGAPPRVAVTPRSVGSVNAPRHRGDPSCARLAIDDGSQSRSS